MVLQLKAAAAKEKAKVLAAKAKVQKAKAEKAERKALLGKRNPSAYALFLLGAIKALGHLPHRKRFEVRLNFFCYYQTCQADCRLFCISQSRDK